MANDYKVKLEVFEGPLDLLLYLIRKDEVDIYDVSIERITKQYMDYLDTFKLLDIDVAGEFLVMAANLLYIKSRSLLPVVQQPPEEETEDDDPRWELIRQLIEYKKFKDAAEHLKSREALQERFFGRLPEKPEFEEADVIPMGEVGIFDLINAFQKVLKRAESKREDLREIFEENYTVSDKIDLILEMTEKASKFQFTALFKDVASRAEIIVTFLALLELIRLKHLKVAQDDAFSEIYIFRVI